MGKLVNVACHLPTGLVITHGKVVMEDGKPKIDPNTGGVKQENIKTVRLYGPNYKADPDNEDQAFGGVVAGFGITRGVDSDWFDDWSKGHGSMLSGNMIFSFENEASIRSKARELRGEKTGFEPIESAEKFESNDGVKLETAERD